MKSLFIRSSIALILSCFTLFSFAQITERSRPKEWDQLVDGASFKDRFLPMKGKIKSPNAWGAKVVKDRYIDNGTESIDNIWSFWGGNIIKDDQGKYHKFVCGWMENSPKGHGEWKHSLVFDAISDNITGPFIPQKIVAKGHNPEIFRLKDGRYVLYVIDAHYVADNINGPWVHGKFDFNPRDRKIIEGLSNLSFAQREDGSYVMVCRGGGIWISKDGLSEYNQLTDESTYPDVEGEFEDPVIWKDHIQYHMIVNDWLGRIAFYLRSKDGIKWVVDPGEAYVPGIAFHEDGTVEDWFKFERIKMYQDEYGRAIQANFAVIDTLKYEDKPNDTHSSKNICIPLNPGMLLTIMDSKPITQKTKYIKVKISAEEGFNPQTDIDLNSLRFGASEEVNYGRGCTVSKTEKSGKDIIVTFKAKGHGITKDEFAPKMIGKTKSGKMLFGYARLPYLEYIEPILSAKAPIFARNDETWNCKIEIQNFGQTTSKEASVKIECLDEEKRTIVVSGKVGALKPYEKTELYLTAKDLPNDDYEHQFIVTISSPEKTYSTFSLKQKVFSSK